MASKKSKELHAEWWKERIARQKAIDASIAAKAEFEYLYDKPYEDNKKVRVAGPFTVESLSPHRVLLWMMNDDWIDGQPKSKSGRKDEADFVQMILENLRLPEFNRRTRKTRSHSLRLPRGPGISCAPRESTSRATESEPRSGPPSSSVLSLALFPAPIWLLPRAKPAMQDLTSDYLCLQLRRAFLRVQ